MRGAGGPLLQDRRRLVLILFVLFATMWTKLIFLNFAMPSPRACQGTTVLSTLADQLTRTMAAVLLLEVVGNSSRSKGNQYAIGAVIATRLVLGIIFAAFTRPQFAPICLARSSQIGMAVLIVMVDGILLAIVTTCNVWHGAWREAWVMPTTTRREQTKAMVFLTVGYALWFVTSIPMLLGVAIVPLFVRVAVPCFGLYLLIGKYFG